jgi:hypothetical protein
MVIHWISLRQARAFVREHHRHLPQVQGGIVALGLWAEGILHGVSIIGRGARLDPPDTATLTRLCTDGYPNACSALYAKSKRLAQALGFVRLKTFTGMEEPGSSLRACGAIEDGETACESWDRPSRQRSGKAAARRRWKL